MNVYTKEQIIEELKRVAGESGGTSLSQDDFELKSTIPKSTLRFHLGSWERALQEAGLTPAPSSPFRKKVHSKKEPKNDDELLKDLVRLYQENREIPSLTLIEEKGNFEVEHYRKRWKSVSEAFLMAGRKFGQPKKKEPEKKIDMMETIPEHVIHPESPGKPLDKEALDKEPLDKEPQAGYREHEDPIVLNGLGFEGPGQDDSMEILDDTNEQTDDSRIIKTPQMPWEEEQNESTGDADEPMELEGLEMQVTGRRDEPELLAPHTREDRQVISSEDGMEMHIDMEDEPEAPVIKPAAVSPRTTPPPKPAASKPVTPKPGPSKPTSPKPDTRKPPAPQDAYSKTTPSTEPAAAVPQKVTPGVTPKATSKVTSKATSTVTANTPPKVFPVEHPGKQKINDNNINHAKPSRRSMTETGPVGRKPVNIKEDELETYNDTLNQPTAPPRKISYIPKTIKPRHGKKTTRVSGEPLNFRGLRFAPADKQGIVFLFGMISHELGYVVEAFMNEPPDAQGKRYLEETTMHWEQVKIQFEFKSSDFQSSGLSEDQADILICWIHDWEEAPIEVLELRSTLEYLNP